MEQSSTSGAGTAVTRGVLLVAVVGLVALAVRYRDNPEFLLIIVGGAALVALLLLGYRAVLRAGERRKAEQLGLELTEAPRRPRELASPDDLARISELAEKFQEGVKVFRDAGKNLYTLPWYVLVGEPGSGKTEALRRCGVPTPPGLGELPGVGGTINMNWWFTTQGVVLDTAGRIMFEEIEAGKTSEWKKFLELLNKTRPNCPVNGLVLVIPVDSLILNTGDEIQKKAGRIARQLDLIQRTLGVRFPVFVVITKSDKINGFRSFFDSMTNPQLAGQILGWSNPATDLDTPFDIEQVDKHLEEVRQRLLNRRMALLIDPVNSADPSARRADQVDDLYSFPDSLVAIAPRLKAYLQLIFVQGPFSPKPLFLRGIYFTSSMWQGEALDKELADALGIGLKDLSQGDPPVVERAFFLKDLFVKKVFPEKGLVTRENKATGLHRRRKFTVLAAGLLTALGLLGLTWYEAGQLDQRIVAHRIWWANLDNWVKSHSDSPEHVISGRLVQPVFAAGKLDPTRYQYAGGADAFADMSQPKGSDTSLSQLLQQGQEQVEAKIEVPAVFRPVAPFEGDLVAGERRKAWRSVLQSVVLVPLLDAVQTKITHEKLNWNDDASAALVELVRLVTPPASPSAAAPGAASVGPARRLRLEPLFRYALGGVNSEQYRAYRKDADALQAEVDWAFAPAQGGPWSPAALPTQLPTAQVIDVGVKTFVDYWRTKLSIDPSGRGGDLTTLTRLQYEFTGLDDARAAAHAALQSAGAGPADLAQYNALLVKWRASIAKVDASGKKIDGLLETLRARPGGWASQRLLDLYRQDLSNDVDRAHAAYDALLEQLPAVPTDSGSAPSAGASSGGVGGSSEPPGPLASAREALERGRMNVPPVDKQISSNTETQLRRFQDDYLTASKGPDGAEQPRYRLLIAAYRWADDQLASPPDYKPAANSRSAAYVPAAGEPLATQLAKLPDRLGAISADLGSAVKSLDARLPRDIPESDQTRADCQFVTSRMAAPLWRYLCIKSAIDGPQAPAKPADVAALVKARAKPSDAPSDRPPTLPFTTFVKGGVYDPQYNAAAATEVVGAWLKVGSALQPPAASAPTLALQAPELVATYQKHGAEAFAPYVADYIAYWDGLLARARDVRVGDWKSFKRGLPDDAAPINDGLIILVNSVDDALRQAGALSALAPPARVAEAAAARQDLVKAAALLRPHAALVVNDRFLQSCGLAVKSWRGLDDDPAKAAAAAFALRAGPFHAAFLIPPPAPADRNVAADYWSELTSQGFEAMFKERGPQPDPAHETRAKFGRFPLAAPAAGVVDLTAQELQDARRQIAAASAAVAALAAPPSDDDKALDPAFRKQFHDLGPRAPSADDARWLGLAQQCIQGLPADNRPRTCTVRTVLLSRQQADKESAGGEELGVNLLNLVAQPGKGFVPSFPRDATDTKLLASLSLSGDPGTVLAIEFKENEDAQPLAPALDALGPWSAVRALYSGRIVKADPSGRVWDLELTQPNYPQPGKRRAVWVELKFDDPIVTFR